jgi:myo-inositol-1(or 4)-monophosphatase
MKNNHSEFLTVAIEAALQAGDILSKGFGTSLEISSKAGRHNLVTQFDTVSEEFIRSFLIERFPSHGFLGEEQGKTKQGDVMWIVDPLDGTVNFAHGIPVFSVSIAAVAEGEVVAGCVFQPMTRELFFAEKGKKAFLNGSELHVTASKSLDDAIVATGFPYNVHEDPLHCIEKFAKIARRGIPIRRLGCASIDLSYVAAGRFDAFWEVTLQPWDFAAGKLLIEEAGGKITQYDGTPLDLFKSTTVLATNTLLHPPLQKELL